MVCKDLKVIADCRVLWDHLDHRVREVLREKEDLLEYKDHQVVMEKMDAMEKMVSKDVKENQVVKDYKDLAEKTERMDVMEETEKMDARVLEENAALKGLQVSKVLQALLDLLDAKDYEENVVYKVSQDVTEKTDVMVAMERMPIAML